MIEYLKKACKYLYLTAALAFLVLAGVCLCTGGDADRMLTFALLFLALFEIYDTKERIR